MKKILMILACMLLLAFPAYGAEESSGMTDMPKRDFSGERQAFGEGEMPQMPFGEGEMPRMPFGDGEMPQMPFGDGEMPQMPFGEGEFPGGQMPPDFNGGRTQGEPALKTPSESPSPEGNAAEPTSTPIPDSSSDTAPPSDSENGSRGPFGGGGMPSGEGREWQNRNPFGQNTIEQEPVTFQSVLRENFTHILSLVLLGLAFLFVIFYRRRRY